jgi:hypothetical protein
MGCLPFTSARILAESPTGGVGLVKALAALLSHPLSSSFCTLLVGCPSGCSDGLGVPGFLRLRPVLEVTVWGLGTVASKYLTLSSSN